MLMDKLGKVSFPTLQYDDNQYIADSSLIIKKLESDYNIKSDNLWVYNHFASKSIEIISIFVYLLNSKYMIHFDYSFFIIYLSFILSIFVMITPTYIQMQQKADEFCLLEKYSKATKLYKDEHKIDQEELNRRMKAM